MTEGLTPVEKAEFERMKRLQALQDDLRASLLKEFVRASGLTLEKSEAVLDTIWEPFRKVLAEEFFHGYREADGFRKKYVTGLLPNSGIPKLEDLMNIIGGPGGWAHKTVLIHTALLKMGPLAPLELSRQVDDLNSEMEVVELKLRGWLKIT